MLNRDWRDKKEKLDNISDISISFASVESLMKVYEEHLQEVCSKQHGLKKADVEVTAKPKEGLVIVSFSGKDIDSLRKVTKQHRYSERVSVISVIAETELGKLFPKAVAVKKWFDPKPDNKVVYRVVLRILD